MPTKKNTASKKPTKAFGNKTRFVLELPQELSAAQVVEEARKNGIAIAENHVHNIRSIARSRARKGSPRPTAPRVRSAASAASPSSSYAKHEALLIEAVVHVGLAKARDLLDRLRAQVKKGL